MSSSAQDLLFEIGTEELPPATLQTMAKSLLASFTDALDVKGLNYEHACYFATPRRIALCISALDNKQADQKIERRGPALNVAYSDNGEPSKALLGFARSCGAEPDQLGKLETNKGSWVVFSKTEEGKETQQLLPEIAENAIAKLPIAKRMNWGSNKIGFVRPVHWILFLYGRSTVACTLLGKEAGNITFGHRFHHPEAITIDTPSEYVEKLHSIGYVIADFDKRKMLIKEQALSAVPNSESKVIIDESLLNEVTGLVEYPHALMGLFDDEFLKVPQEALISAMQEHQKYFPLVNKVGQLLPNFILISNINSSHPEHVIAGNEKVIRPRLADAKFFYDMDSKQTLENRNQSLKNIVFQTKLGSLLDKSTRISLLAQYIAEQIGADVQLSARAALLCKADLNSDMVGEFPDLQGTMGYYYALNDGEEKSVALAIKEHYQPKFSGDEIPESLISASVALADKIDTLAGIFGIGLIPTGDKDPFALRRATLGIIRLIIEKYLPLDLAPLIDKSISLFDNKLTNKSAATDILDFILARFRAHYKAQGVATEIILSVEKLRPSKPLDFDKRINAVKQFVLLPEAKALSAANKRVQNILNKQKSEDIKGSLQDDLLQEDAEKNLAKKLQEKEASLQPLFQQGDYSSALIQLAELRVFVDEFFDNVMVMCEDKKLRNNRLLLLSKLRNLFLEVADISVLPN